MIMKKLLFIYITLLFGVISVEAQTMFYKALFTVEELSGMKMSKKMNDMYITFANGKRPCYISDKNGKSTSAYACYYKGEENGMYIYQEETQKLGFGFTVGGSITLLFSKDFKRLNYRDSIVPKYVSVFEYSEEPERQNAPTQLY